MLLRLLLRTALLASLVSLGCTRQAEPEPLVLGHLAPFSGRERVLGEQAARGIELAIAEVNSGETAAGQRPLAVIHVDTKADPDLAGQQAVRLVKINNVAGLLGGMSEPQAVTIAARAEQLGAFLITPTGVGRGSSWRGVISLGLEPARRGEALARFSREQLQADKVPVLVAGDRAGSVALAEGFAATLADTGSQRGEYLEYRSGPELTAQLTRLQQTKARVVCLAGPPADLALLREKLADVQPAPAILYGGEEADCTLVSKDSLAGEGVYLTTCFVATDEAAERGDFVKKFTERFQRPPDANALLAYDGVRLAAHLLRTTRIARWPRSAEEVGKLLTQLDWHTGPLAEAHPDRRPVLLVRLEKGTPQVVARFPPRTGSSLQAGPKP